MDLVDKLLDSVKAIAPLIREHAAEAEREQRLSTAAANAMRDAGLYKMFRAKARGGFEADPVTGFRVLEEVSRIDSAAGWNLQLSNGVDMFGPWFSDSTTEQVFGPEKTILGGSFNPPRKAVPVAGGYRVTGRTSFVSGAHNDTMFVGLANIYDAGVMRTGPGGGPITLLTIVPSEQGEIIDNWNTLGMSGTGSHDVALNDVFVPEERAVPFVPLGTRSEAYSGPLYRLTIWPAIAVLAPPALGIARAALDDLIDLATKKTPAYILKSLRDRSVVQSQLGQAEAKLGAARAYLHDVFDRAYADAVKGKSITMEYKCKAQLAATHAILAAAEAVDLVHAAVGASGIRREYRFQKYFRDVHVITQHAFTSASRFESVGQILMGLEPEWSFFAF
jgi:indole-3-acetate monooxygenase